MLSWVSSCFGLIFKLCPRGEMDITAGFGPAIGGSNPSGGKLVPAYYLSWDSKGRSEAKPNVRGKRASVALRAAQDRIPPGAKSSL